MSLESLVQRKRFPSGTIIFREREPASHAYVVESGRVEISTKVDDANKVLTTLGPGEMFGEMAALDGTGRSATAKAVEDTELTLIFHDQLRSRVDAAEPVLRLLLRVILDRFRREQKLFRHLRATPLTLSPAEAEFSKRAIDEMKLESELREAVARGGLTVHYQPVVRLETGEVAGFEALSRWTHPVFGEVPPARFIALAEETAAIVPLGRTVLERACLDLNALESRFGRKLFMCVNVSARQFCEPSFCDEVADILRRTGVDPSSLELEITETVFMDHRAAPLGWLERLRALGVRIALDDFGTGFSSLSYLAAFPLDTIKIDISFVRTMLQDERTLAIVLAIRELARGLELEIIAEGIEVPAQRDKLAEMGCELGQGYLFSGALPLAEVLALAPSPRRSRDDTAADEEANEMRAKSRSRPRF